MVERKTRFTIINLMPDYSAKSMMKAIICELGKLPANMRKTITTDRGREFTCWQKVEDALKARELIKINSLETTPIMPKELANIIAEKVKCDVVQVVGRKMIFYKRNDKDPKIVLPKSKK